MDSNKSIGGRIKQIRIAKGLTMEEFGKIFDPPANKSLVSKWENGKSLPNNDRLKKITEIGNISMEFLLEGIFDLKKIPDLPLGFKDQYLKELVNYTKYEAIDKLNKNYTSKNDIESYEEARFIDEVFTFIENSKKNKADKEILYTATEIFSILNLLSREFSNEKMNTDFKLESIEFHKDSYNSSTDLLYSAYTNLLKDNYL